MGKHIKDGELYQPSNGSEGDWFESKFCMQCLHTNPDPMGKKQCKIWCRAICYRPGDPEYPREWQYQNDKPVCTNWQKWDWGNDGDPDDPDNPKAPPPPPDPNQMDLFPVYPDERNYETVKVKEVVNE